MFLILARNLEEICQILKIELLSYIQPRQSAMFSVKIYTEIFDFFMQTYKEKFKNRYLQHFRLFKHFLSNKQEDHTIDLQVQIETPLVILPLSESVTIEAYEAEQLAREHAAAEIMHNDALKNQGKDKLL